MKAALYLRVSTFDQTTQNQERELRAAASSRLRPGFAPLTSGRTNHKHLVGGGLFQGAKAGHLEPRGVPW
jgi:hypothetical protein